MAWFDQEKTNIFGKREQVCWSCSKCTGLCSWSHEGIPIDGWDSEKDEIHFGTQKMRITQTYRIYSCPEYHNVEKEKKEINDILEECRRAYNKVKKGIRDGKRKEDKTKSATV